MNKNPVAETYREAARAVAAYQKTLVVFALAWRSFDGQEEEGVFEIAVSEIETSCAKARAALDALAAVDSTAEEQIKLNARALPFIGPAEVKALGRLFDDMATDLEAIGAAPVEH